MLGGDSNMSAIKQCDPGPVCTAVDEGLGTRPLVSLDEPFSLPLTFLQTNTSQTHFTELFLAQTKIPHTKPGEDSHVHTHPLLAG